ncbi:MAG: dihydrolipoyl dehydrogenase [Candidatus Izemoplasmataceae bacterium]
MKKHDIVIIGGGPGGYVAAIKAAQLGYNVAVVEKDAIGGVCLNWGCIPTKAMLKTAKVYKQFMHLEDYGLSMKDKGAVSIDWDNIIKRKDKIVKRLTDGVRGLLKKNKVTVYNGMGTVKDAYHIEVNGEELETKKLIIATGASPAFPPIEGLKEGFEAGTVVTSKEILSLDKLPKNLVVIGGGVIGVEFATLYGNLGVNVTIIEAQKQILTPVDGEIRKAYAKLLDIEHINVLTSASVKKVTNDSVTYEFDGKETTIDADKILLSVGMKANLKGLEALSLEQSKGSIKTDEFLRTNIKDVYAIGDVNGIMMLAHVASAEGIIAVEHIHDQDNTVGIDYFKVPSGIYGFPEIAFVGMTEEQLKERKINYKISKFPLAANGKALAEGESEGFIKILADKEYGELLGVHILGPNATDMIAEAVTTMELEGTVHELARAIHPHPTLSEIVMEAAHGVIDKPIHI